MDTTQKDSEQHPKKCFCARCFLPIEPEEKVDVDGQNFHRLCSMCCICRQVPTSLKMFYGHVFCNECFKTHVMNRFRGELPRMQTNSWWMQWMPGTNPMDNKMCPQEQNLPNETEGAPATPQDQPEQKRCICARCLQAVDEKMKVDIDGQSFHPQCARCYFCHCVPTNNVKIYYGQVFCEECFNKYVMARNKETPAEHFRTCLEQWQNNGQFNENMRDFMAGKGASPMIFMMQGAHPPFCRCGTTPQQNREWFQSSPTTEPKKSATPATASLEELSLGTCDLSLENRTEPSEFRATESANENFEVAAAEKIAKLTKYLREQEESEKSSKKWKNFIEHDKCSIGSEVDPFFRWVDISDPKRRNENCPKCLWQCGRIFVNSDYFKKEVICEENYGWL